jgi:hypothetical protein
MVILETKFNLDGWSTLSYHLVDGKEGSENKRKLAIERLECIDKEVNVFLGSGYYKRKIVEAAIRDWQERGFTILKSILNEKENAELLKEIPYFIEYCSNYGDNIGPGLKQIDLLKEVNKKSKKKKNFARTLDAFMKSLAIRIENIVKDFKMPGTGWDKIECRFVKLLSQKPFEVQSNKLLEGLLHSDYETETFISGIYTLEDNTLATQIPKESVQTAKVKRDLLEKYHAGKDVREEFRNLAQKLTQMALGCETYPNVRLNGGDLMLFSSIIDHQTMRLLDPNRTLLYVTFFPQGEKGEVYNTDYQFFPWSPLMFYRDPEDLILLYFLLANLWYKGYPVWLRWDTPEGVDSVMKKVQRLQKNLKAQNALLDITWKDSNVVENYKAMKLEAVQKISNALATCLELDY